MSSGNTLWGLSDTRYVRLDGQTPMSGPLSLPGDPTQDAQAATKRYVDALIAGVRSGILTAAQVAVMIAVLTDAGGTIDARIAASVANYVPLDGSVAMTGLLTLSGDPLLAMEAATKQYVDALPVGLATYDAVVSADPDADYASVVDACAGEAVGARIYIKAGTYTETASILLKDGQQLIGENPDVTLIDFSAGAFKIVRTGATANLVVKNLTIQNGVADYTVDLFGDNSRVDNCRMIGSGAAFSGLNIQGNESVITRTRFTGYSRVNFMCANIENYGVVSGCTFETSSRGLQLQDYCTAVGNVFETIADSQIVFAGFASCAMGNIFNGGSRLLISQDNISIVGNFIAGAAGIYWEAAHDNGVIANNTFVGSQIDCDKNGSEEWSISCNAFSGGGGISCDGQRWSITGNSFLGVANILLDTNSLQCIVSGNSMWGITAAAKITDNGNINMAHNNAGVSLGDAKTFYRMKNTSGGDLLAGHVVVIKQVAAGDEFTTTVALGDEYTLGMLETDTVNNAYGPVQTRGFTSKLKVNGAVNIGIGDHLVTTNSAGIARKSAANNMFFAMALEAYAGADDNGVIDAILFPPRHE